MNDKVKLSKRNGRISRGIRVAVSATLALVLTYIITSSLNLSDLIKYTIMFTLCFITSVIVASRPKFVLTVICILVFSIGVLLVLLAQNQKLISEIGWDASLLGAGASIIAIAIAFYALLIQTGQREEANNLTDSGRKISNSKKVMYGLKKLRNIVASIV